MKQSSKRIQWLGYVAAVAGLTAGCMAPSVRAQEAVPAPEVVPAPEAVGAATTGRFYVEIKDATLYDAILMVQQSAGRTDYQVDEAAKGVFVGAVTFNNAPWDSIIRRLVNESNFRIVPQPNGTKQIEPRPQLNYGGEGGYGSEGGYPGSGSGSSGYGSGGSGSSGYGSGSSSGYGSGGSGSSGYGGRSSSSGLPSNPFNGGSGSSDRRSGRRPQVQQFENRQTLPGGLGGSPTSGDNAGKEYRLVPVRHVYVGGIAKLFANADIIGTEDFLIPDGALGGGQNGGGNQGGFGGNQGGFGGNQGGFGGNQGGFGGNQGGFGGNQGGFGGGGFGGGGFGGGGGLNNAVNGGFGF